MFTEILLTWFAENQRALPWRGQTDPYRIWVSEVILQQTRVAQGTQYYYNFLEKFPTVAALAAASEAEVLKAWQGLGYYSRARNMHAAAKSIVAEHDGQFPQDYAGIRKLKGVGDYTAAAVASIAFGLPYPAVDGNVLRFVARYAGIFDNIALPATRKTIEQWCAKRIPAQTPGTFNQAMMEMGATCCTPQNPNCENCPLQLDCHARQHNQVDILPVKEMSIRIRERHFHYLIFACNGKTILQQRTRNDIWKGLWEFPLVETPTPDFDLRLFLRENKISPLNTPIQLLEKKHQLTHQTILADFQIIPVKKLPAIISEQKIIEISDLQEFAVSKITEQAIIFWLKRY